MPLAVLLVALSVVNRKPVTLGLNPFDASSGFAIEAPLFLFLLGAFAIGLVVGGLATWLGQGKWRRLVRSRTHEALRWKGEAERLQRERDAQLASARAEPRSEPRKHLALANR